MVILTRKYFNFISASFFVNRSTPALSDRTECGEKSDVGQSLRAQLSSIKLFSFLNLSSSPGLKHQKRSRLQAYPEKVWLPCSHVYGDHPFIRYRCWRYGCVFEINQRKGCDDPHPEQLGFYRRLVVFVCSNHFIRLFSLLTTVCYQQNAWPCQLICPEYSTVVFLFLSELLHTHHPHMLLLCSIFMK